MNASQTKYAVQRITSITAERIVNVIKTYTADHRKHAKLLDVTVSAFTEAQPAPYTVMTANLDKTATIANIFNLAGVIAQGKASYATAMHKYDVSVMTSSYHYVTNPLTGVLGTTTHCSDRVKPLVARLQAKLVQAVDGIVLGGADEAQEIIKNF